MNFRLTAAIFAASAIACGSASAATIEGATAGISSPDSVITFSELGAMATGTEITNQFQSLGVTFDPKAFYFDSVTARPNTSGAVLTNFVGGANAEFINPFSINFTADVSAASFTLTSPIRNATFEALKDGVVISMFSTVLNPNNNVATDTMNIYGFFDVVFDEIRVTIGAAGSSNAVVIDNLAFTQAVPLPAALPLFLAGMAGLGFAGRRKKV